MKTKKAIKKVKAAANVAVKHTRVLAKKAGKEAKTMVKTLQEKWKSTEPAREKYGEELKEAFQNTVKIGGDIAAVIKKDIQEIRDNNEGKK